MTQIIAIINSVNTKGIRWKSHVDLPAGTRVGCFAVRNVLYEKVQMQCRHSCSDIPRGKYT